MATLPDASILATWRKSTYSETGAGSCVEVSDGHPAQVPVRDSNSRHGPALVFPTTAWAAFVTAVKEKTAPTA